MKETLHISTQAELEALIGQYFEGKTTLEQEDSLRRCLAHCPWSSEAIDEARMVMGYFAVHSAWQQRRATRGLRQRAVGIAASVALILAVGGYVIWHQHQPSDVCIAYVNGHVVNGDEQVMAMVTADLDRLNDVSGAMTNQLSTLGEALELDNE